MQRFLKLSLLLGLLGVLGLPSSGCGYLRDRLKDGTEIFEAGAGVSLGFAVNVRATKLAQAGLGSYGGFWAGLKEGRFADWEEERVEMGISPFYYQEMSRRSDQLLDFRRAVPDESGYGSFSNDLFLLTDRGFFEVGVTANVLFLGLDLSVELAELADLLTGVFGFDLLSDDGYAPSPEILVNQMQSRDADKRAAAVRGLLHRMGRDFHYVAVAARDEHPQDQIDAWKRAKAWLHSRESGTDG